ncbi:hypothetical protein [Psychrobacter sp. NPDC078929]|uniref:hypothetical protein n=1 Tax=unclassified Psychrobacter TaxID=196806 RepID=UPI003D01E7E5
MHDDHTKPQTTPQNTHHSAATAPSSRSFTRRVLVPVLALIALFLMLIMPSCQPMPLVIAMTDDTAQAMAQEGT